MMTSSRHITALAQLFKRVCLIVPVFFVLLVCQRPAFAANETFATGSYVIDMGLSPQTVANALKPYGLLQDLVINNKVPMAWVINPVKAKDGIDFSHNGKDYRAGPFVIDASFAATAAPIIQDWISNRGLDGSVVNITVSPITVPVYDTVTVFPRAVMDVDNGDIATDYMVNAGVDSSFYRIDTPASLTECDDVFTMPHADPTWATHQNLISFNQQGGLIWAACHAVSVMEAIDDPGDADSAPDLNFLSTNGLIDFGVHNDGSPPYSYAAASDPVMQILGVIDAATENGSEQIYLPLDGSSWRPSTTIATWDPDNAEVGPSPLSPGEAAIIAYGHGFGNSSNGLVMYEAGHDHDRGNGSASIGAQRAYLNFILLSGFERYPQITAMVPPLAQPLDPLNLSASFTGGTGGPYVYNWTDDCGGSFNDPTISNPVFTTPATSGDLTCNLTVAVSDGCVNTTFTVESILILGEPDLVIVKSDLQDPSPISGNVVYTLDITNTGSEASAVTVSDVLPPEVSYISVVPSTGSCSESSGTVTCSLGTLANGAAESIVITTGAPAIAITINNTATVSSPDGDLNPSNNSDTETTVIGPAVDLALTKTVSPATVKVGENAVYTLTASNNDLLATVTDIVLADVLPAGVSYVSAIGPGWTCNYVAPDLDCQLASLAPSSNSQLLVTVTGTGSGTQINNAAIASTVFAESNVSDNSASAALLVQNAADLEIIKTANKVNVDDNKNVKFFLDITNNGPDTADNVVVTDTLAFSNNKNNADGFKDFYKFSDYFFTFPDGTRIQGGTSVRQVTHNGITITVDYNPATTGPLTDKKPTPQPADGTDVTITWTVSPGLDSGDTLTLEFKAKKVSKTQSENAATVSSTTTDPNPANNSDSILVGKETPGGTKIKYADLEVQKVAVLNPMAADDPFNIISTIDVNTNFSYAISILNNGPDKIKKGDAGDGFSTITVVDTLPVGVTYLGFNDLGADVGHSLPAGDLEGGGAVKEGTWSCSYNLPTREVTCIYTLDQGDNFDKNKYSEDLIINVSSPGSGGLITNTVDQLTFNVPPAVSSDVWTDPYSFNNDSSWDVTVTGTTDISGTVFSDFAHDGINDLGDPGIAGVTVALYNTGTFTCVSTQTNVSGNYSFTSVADGNYQIIEAATESVPVPAICPPVEQDPVGYFSTTANTLNITASGTTFTDQDFGDFNGSRYEGNVFEDNGTGGGTAHDGSINGGENGLSGITVEANNGATLDSTTTDVNGSFTLWLPDAASGTNVDILTTTPGSFISVSKSDGGAGDSSPAISLDQITVIPVSGQAYSGITFGDAREPAFAPDHSRSASPGSNIFYAHTFTAYTTGTVDFSAASLIAIPNVPGWSAVLYDDSNCNGTLDSGETVHSAAIVTDADTTSQVCLIVQVFVPANAPANAQYTVTLAATFNYDASSLTTVRNRTELTTVGDSSLVLVKVVDKPTAQPGELLTYTISYTNAGSDTLSTIVIDDKTPAFTTFTNASCVLPLPATLTACSATTQPGIGATGPIQWTFNPGDNLQSGSSGQVQYQVTVDN